MKSKETKQRFSLVVIEEVALSIEVSEKIKLMLEEFKRVVHDELLEGLPPMKDIQHYIDLIPPMKDIQHYMILFQGQVYLTCHTTWVLTYIAYLMSHFHIYYFLELCYLMILMFNGMPV